MQKLISKINNIITNDMFLLTILYFISFGLILFNGGIFFDDWVFFNQENITRINLFKDLGFFLYWPAYLHNILLGFNIGIFIERCIIFLSYLISGIFLFNILRTIKQIDRISRFFIVAFFMLVPVNFARIFLCNIHYAISYLLFYLGLYITTKYLSNKIIIFRVLALIVLFFSFSTNSILIFYLLVLFYLIYFNITQKISFNSVYKLVVKYLDYFLLPVVFWIVKNNLFYNMGIYAENYNELKLKCILISPYNFLFALDLSFMEVIKKSLKDLNGEFLLVFILSFILFIILKKRFVVYEILRSFRKSLNKTTSYLVFGVSVFFIGVFPYMIVEKMPRLDYIESRHQLLVPLGISFIVFYGLQIIYRHLQVRKKTQIFIYTFFIGIFVYSNFIQNIKYLEDELKQRSIIEQIRDSNIIRDNRTFLINNYVEKNRVYRFYEYTGMFKLVFGSEERFGEDTRVFSTINKYEKYKKYAQYNFRDYKLEKPKYEIILKSGDLKLDSKEVIKMILYRLLKPKKFEESIKNIVKLEFVEYKKSKLP